MDYLTFWVNFQSHKLFSASAKFLGKSKFVEKFTQKKAIRHIWRVANGLDDPKLDYKMCYVIQGK